MPKVLTEDQIATYARDGFLFPFDVCSAAEAAEMHRKFQEMEETLGEEPQERFRVKAHLPFPWLCDLVRHPRLLDALEDLIGPDILCWGASFFTKKANDPRYISWHTDTFFYGFDPPETATAWFSFNEATEEAGCLRYIPGSHKTKSIHDFHPGPNNLAPAGQTVRDVDESKAVYTPLSPGQVVFHHESVVHSSMPNRSNHPRIGLSIHYCAPHVRETRFDGLTAMLLRGECKYDHWGFDPEPAADYDEACIAAMMDTRAKFLEATNRKVTEGVRT